MSLHGLPQWMDPAGALAAMRRTLFVIALLSAHAFALNPDWNLQQLGHRAWKIDDGYLNGQVYALAQDKDGYLWLGTSNGLVRFDGLHFTPWNPPENTPSPGYVDSLLADRDGSLWIGSYTGLMHLDHDRVTRYKDLTGQVVRSLFQDESGAVWFATYSFKGKSEDVLCRVAGEKLKCFGKKDGLSPPAPAQRLARDASGTFWLGRSDSILSWREGFAKVYDLEQLKNNTNQSGVTGLAIDTDNSLFVGIGKRGMGLQHFRNGQWSTVTAPGFDGSSHAVSVLYLDRHHALWVGTMDEGIYRLYQGRIDHFGHTDGLSADFVRGIYEDREGSIWISTSEGLDQLRDLAVRSFSRMVYPKAREFDNVVTLPNGTMWVGGTGALYTLSREGNQFIPQGKDLAGKQVTTIFGDRSQRVWVGLDNTLNLFSDERFRPVKMQDGRPVGFVVSMAEDAAAGLFAITIGPPRTLLSIDAKTLRASAVLPELDASKIAADPREGIWIGTNGGGIQYLSGEKITGYPLAPQSSSRISQLTVTPSGEVLAAGDFGLAFLTGGTSHILSTANGLPCPLVNSFLFDEAGNLWLYTACGLVKLSASELQRWKNSSFAQLTPRIFDSSDGFKVNIPPFEGAARSADGRLWFNNQQSLLMIDPMRIQENALPPPVHIQAIRADRRDYTVAENVKLPPLTRDIEIGYAVLSFVFPEKNRSRYRLSEFEKQWHDAGAQSRAEYTNLKPGTYSFHVIACNNDGIWNETGATLRFTILPAWYQTFWFRCMYVVASAFLLWTLYRLRLRQMERQYSARMEERVRERTRIARELHDTLLQSFQGLLLVFQAASNLLPNRPDDAKKKLDGAIDKTRQALTEGRGAVQGLRSTPAIGCDLAEAVRTLGDELAVGGDGHKPPDFEVVVEGESRNLHPIVRDDVYRIAAEALRNAFAHAEANRIEIEIRYDAFRFRLRIRDDGKGIDSDLLGDEGRPGHWGLQGMRERARLIGGKLEIWSNVQSGTELELTIPSSIAYDAKTSSRSSELL